MGTCSSVPSESSLPQVLWKTFGAVPVLPFPAKLKVFSVLVKENGSFWRIGDLASLCAEGEAKKVLKNLIDNTDQSITVSKQLGFIDNQVANDTRLSTQLLAFQTGVAAGLKDVQTWRIRVPSHQCSYADEEILDRVLKEFVPDQRNRHFARNRKLYVWIVTEVITAPSVSGYALDRRGANIGLSLPPLAPLPVDVQVTLEGEGGSTEFFIRRGAEVDGTVGPLPVAFRGWKYKYQRIVTEVITAPSVSGYALDRRGANIGLSLPPLAPLPVDVQVTLEGEGGSTEFFIRRGAEVDGTVGPLPVAFRGWKYKYQNGFLKNPRRARYESDSLHSPPLNGAPERPLPHARAATPLNDPDMVDLVGEDEWVTTILDDEDL